MQLGKNGFACVWGLSRIALLDTKRLPSIQ
jgi:hypothetical protein